MAKLHPPFPLELPVSGADRVGMKSKSPRQFSRTRQTLPRSEVVAEDTQDDLGYELFADSNFTSASEPKLHDGLS
jgi:hypothetical protein